MTINKEVDRQVDGNSKNCTLSVSVCVCRQGIFFRRNLKRKKQQKFFVSERATVNSKINNDVYEILFDE